MSNILDNTPQKKVGDWLQNHIQKNDSLSIVSAYFSIYGYEILKDKLNDSSIKFLFGDPNNVGNVDPTPGQDKSFSLGDDSKLLADNPLTQKWVARECEQWAQKDSTEIRAITQKRLMHGKMYHLLHSDGSQHAVSGSSNFTKNGLGKDSNSNLELNLITEKSATTDLKLWFDALWNDDERVEDVKQTVLNALKRLGENQSPEFVYFKTLYHVFENRLHSLKEEEELSNKIDFDQTAIWKKLYPFQKQGVKGAINRLNRFNGCIIADSVGLGKTYSALAVIKYFELRNENVLVLCPKRLRENWTRYLAAVADKNNPLKDDRLQYHVLSHTDLSRERGMVGDIDLEKINWSNYSLIVIDESHNFRNIPTTRKDKDGNELISRYKFLMKEVIQKGVRSKILMLSATPVNNSLKDLTNQINLIGEDKDNAFNIPELEIPSVRTLMSSAQRHFTEWQKASVKPKKEDLFNKLSDNFFRLLDGLTIARSRGHIQQFYPDFVKNEGYFPERSRPDNLRPETDTDGELKYEDMANRIDQLNLAIYYPSNFLRNDAKEIHNRLEDERKKWHFNQKDREKVLIALMRINFLKRLESSIDAFRTTIDRTINKMELLSEKIQKYKKGQSVTLEDIVEVDEESLEDIDDEYIIGNKSWRYHFEQINLDGWMQKIEEDRKLLTNILEIAKKVTIKRDQKFNYLKQQIEEKIKNPTTDKQGNLNHKILIFTTFADTAKYLYNNLESCIKEHGINIAQVAGGKNIKTTVGRSDYQEILNRFAPCGRECGEQDEQIDVLIATDCISEGQNLQDCDMVVNYDIHWNPVRIIQRFGRIDRLNSQNKKLYMTNFWPPMELEKYLALQKRVMTRMELVNMAATGRDNLLSDGNTENQTEKIQMDLDFRSQQIKRLQDEILDTEQTNENGFELSDFTLDDFLAELIAFMEKSGEALKTSPFGLFSVMPTKNNDTKSYPAGAIFCLRKKTDNATDGMLSPCRLAFIDNDDNLHLIGKPVLTAMRTLARNKANPILPLADAFDRKTDNGKNMTEENKKVQKVIIELNNQNKKEESQRVSSGGLFAKRSERANTANDYDLITWFVTAHE